MVVAKCKLTVAQIAARVRNGESYRSIGIDAGVSSSRIHSILRDAYERKIQPHEDLAELEAGTLKVPVGEAARIRYRAMGLSVRAVNVLINGGLYTADQVRAYGRPKLLRIPNCGARTARHIEDLFNGQGKI